MSLKNAILVLLEGKPGTGYDLAQRFRGGIGQFWSASHQQIYQELKALGQEGLVEFELQEQASRPDRKHYRITPEGRASLKGWLEAAWKPERISSAILMRLYAANLADPAPLLAELERNLAQFRDKLDEYLQLEASHLDRSGNSSRRQALVYVALRFGIRNLQSWMTLLTEVRALLTEGKVPDQPALKP
ncbi:PadR family transcriptional regulator [Solimonas sp. K1W22B-7]|uniref:PadR family transcriptional regulator n=1 Tax=Solimonas sp. K1W22B-7 TaxID=2303331 RepID=UPI000E33780B|nr:PadR family transcriptional regulator [Solimonas sp. K1W22B-7]AXQ28384.1 PadR family transcriptional regulator [Solimonas sp. K1W22B-7]